MHFPNVIQQQRPTGKALLTGLKEALECLVAAVRELVGLQVLLPHHSLVAHVAGEGSVLVVGLLVSGQFGRSLKSHVAVTDIACISLFVCSDETMFIFNVEFKNKTKN